MFPRKLIVLLALLITGTFSLALATAISRSGDDTTTSAQPTSSPTATSTEDPFPSDEPTPAESPTAEPTDEPTPEPSPSEPLALPTPSFIAEPPPPSMPTTGAPGVIGVIAVALVVSGGAARVMSRADA